MDISSFLTALVAVIVIDLVLAGDNAIVIALAARGLPEHLRKRAITWGAIGAIAVRSAMTLAVVWLLQIPGLMLVGGLMLYWIAYRLLVPSQDDSADGHGKPATSFWGAMRTIIVADAVMGLDNVLAVAGAAHGSYWLVVIGLAVSVPIVIWGSTFVLKWVDRYPAIVYLGGGVLVWTAVKMVTQDSLIRPTADAHPVLAWLAHMTIPLVLAIGFLVNHRRFESRIHARLKDFAAQCPARDSQAEGPDSVPNEGDKAMLKILVPVDGSSNALGAVRHAIREYQRNHELELHLLNVQPPFWGHLSRFVSRADRQAWHRDRAQEALAPAQQLLAAQQIPSQTHMAVGNKAHEICHMAQTLAVDHIVMGTARKNSITRMLEDSTTNQVLESTPVPVEVIAGQSISPAERWGVPLAALLGLGSLALAVAE